MQYLKADLHIHTAEDPYDAVEWNAKRVIDESAKRGFRVLAITNHMSVCYSDALALYAERKQIVLIPGCEAQYGRRHVLLLNPTPEALKCRSLEELREAKRAPNKMAVIAPHPFFPSRSSLREWLYRYADVFDAVEWHSYYFRWINFNRFAFQAAKRLGLPMVGGSDTHFPIQLEKTFTMVDAEPSIESVIEAIIEGRCRVVTRPFSFDTFAIYLGMKGLQVPDRWFISKDKDFFEVNYKL